MTNEATAEVADANQDLYNLPMLVAGSAVFILYVKLLQNRKYWVTMEIGLGVACSLVFPFAGLLSSNLMKSSDGLTTYMFQLLLVTLASQAAAVYFAQKSAGRAVTIVVSISNILARGQLLMMFTSLVYSDKSFTKRKESAYFDIIFTAMLLFGDIYHIAKSKTRSYTGRGHTVGDPISFHLSVDALVTFFLGSLMLGFSDMFCSIVGPGFAANDRHFSNVKGVGSMLLAGSMRSFASLCYRDNDDAMATLKTKLIVYLPAFLLAVKNIVIDEHFQTYGHVTIMLGVTGGLILNCVIMLYIHKRKV